jgi:four helix bundle protein
MQVAVMNYTELIAWQKAMDLVEEIYAATKQFPKEELYGLVSQLRRAAVSMASNIAEGQGRKSLKEFLHHLSIAYGSLREVETQVRIAGRLGYLGNDQAGHVLGSCAEVGRLINGLSNSLSSQIGNVAIGRAVARTSTRS